MNDNIKQYLIDSGAVWKNEHEIDYFHQPNIDDCKPRISIACQQVILSVEGKDTARFLQGQLTCNVETLSGSYTLGTACDRKGRMFASFTLLETTKKDSFLMKMHHSISSEFITRMQKYILFYQSDIKTTDYLCLHLSTQGSSNAETYLKKCFGVLPAQGQLVSQEAVFCLQSSHRQNAYEIWLPEAVFSQWWEKLQNIFLAVGDKYWLCEQIQAVIPQVTQAIIDKYTPQHLNMPALNAVSFTKRCYTGQEVISRMYNLGKEKTKTYCFFINSHVAIKENAVLENAQGKKIGSVLTVACVKNNNYYFLAVANIQAVEEQTIFLQGNHPVLEYKK